jgi:hypothetical protein
VIVSVGDEAAPNVPTEWIWMVLMPFVLGSIDPAVIFCRPETGQVVELQIRDVALAVLATVLAAVSESPCACFLVW